MNLKMKKNLHSSVLTSLSIRDAGASYADKNVPKQTQVCINNFGNAVNSSF